MEQAHEVTWIDRGCEPQCPPNPAYPNGMDTDISLGADTSCKVDLPYPAKRCGMYVVYCKACDQRVAITTAGRPDDPRSLRLACKDRPRP